MSRLILGIKIGHIHISLYLLMFSFRSFYLAGRWRGGGGGGGGGAGKGRAKFV